MDHQPLKCELKKKLVVERITPQRILIFDIIKDHHGHLHVEEIYRIAQKKDPKINLSTIYRTLKEFKKAGIVDELHLEEDHHHYERTDKTAHHHLVCEKCGSVVDFKSSHIARLRQDAAKHGQFSVSKVQVLMYGTCRTCKKQVL